MDYHATPKYPCRNGLEYDWFVKLTDSPPIAQVFDFINKYNNQIITGKVLQLEDHAELEKRYAELQIKYLQYKNKPVVTTISLPLRSP